MKNRSYLTDAVGARRSSELRTHGRKCVIQSRNNCRVLDLGEMWWAEDGCGEMRSRSSNWIHLYLLGSCRRRWGRSEGGRKERKWKKEEWLERERYHDFILVKGRGAFDSLEYFRSWFLPRYVILNSPVAFI